jgi:hypothetical protein
MPCIYIHFKILKCACKVFFRNMRLHIKILVQFFINGYSYFKVNIMHKAR